MQENKEFEEYSKSYSSKTQSLYDTIGAVSKFLIPDLDRFRQESYEAGQQSEREKHRWIPVTERLPTKHDGKPEYEGDERYTRIIVHITEYYGKKWDRVMEIRFFEGTDFSQFCYKFDKWQPLPEA